MGDTTKKLLVNPIPSHGQSLSTTEKSFAGDSVILHTFIAKTKYSEKLSRIQLPKDFPMASSASPEALKPG